MDTFAHPLGIHQIGLIRVNDKTSDHNARLGGTGAPGKPGGSGPSLSAPAKRAVSSGGAGNPLLTEGKKSGGLLALVLVLLLYVLVGLCVVHFCIQLEPALARKGWVTLLLAENQEPYQAEMETIINEQGENIVLLSRQSASLVEQVGALDQQVDDLDQHIKNIRPSDHQKWRLAEAEYLLRLANQRLLMSHDTASSRALLEQANVLLMSFTETTLLDVRQLIAEEMNALRATPIVGINDTWLEINALAARVAALPLVKSARLGEDMAPTESVKPVTADPAPQNVAEKLSVLFEQLRESFFSLFQLRKVSNPSLEFVSPDQEIYLRQNMQLALEQAKLALLQGREAVYRTSIATARSWAQRWFHQNDQESLLWRETLANLAQAEVQQQMPDISRSLKALSKYIQTTLKKGSGGSKAHKTSNSKPAAGATLPRDGSVL